MNEYRKKVPPPDPKRSAREAVTLFGDDWRLLGNTVYSWRDTMTPDQFDAVAMRYMERGEWGRIR